MAWSLPRGCWTYAPRHQYRQHKIPSPLRPLVVFRDNRLLGCSQDKRAVYRRDFHLDRGEKFDTTWISGWTLGSNANKGTADAWRSQRLARGAAWSVPVFADEAPDQHVAAMVLAGDTLFLAGVPGRLFVATQDGRVICPGE